MPRIAMSAEGAPGRRRPIVIVGLEPVSADWVHELLVRSSRRHRKEGNEPRLRAVRIKAGKPRWYSTALLLDGKQSECDFIIGEFGPWLRKFEGCELVYLRPGLMVLKDILPGINRTARAVGANVDLIDRRLANLPTVSLESLFYEPQKLGELLSSRYGIKLDLSDLPPDREARYQKALLATLGIVDRGLFSGKPEMVFALGSTYGVTDRGAGSRALEAGWSSPENEHTWSNGPRASLRIPVAARRGARVRLRLDGVLAQGVSMRVFADGRLALTVHKTGNPPRDQPVAISLPYRIARRPVLFADLEFDNTYCPKDRGNGSDDRQLGIALSSFTVSEESMPPNSLRSLIAWRRPETTLALSLPSPDADVNISTTLTEAGLSGALITLVCARPDNARWLENGRAVEFGEGGLTARGDTPPLSPFRMVSFAGTLAQLLAELSVRRIRLDLIVLSTVDLFREVMDDLVPVRDALPSALPDLAIRCKEPGYFFERLLYPLGERYWQIISRYGIFAADEELISFTGQAS
jgi:hypothetical protein